MRGPIAILLVLVFSCNYFETQKLSKEEILNEELQTMDWNDVDEYPTFTNCESSSNDKSRRECFENTIRSSILKILSQHSFVVNEDIEDTLVLTIHIDKTGMIVFKDISMSESISRNIPEMDSLLRQSLMTLPKIHPAIKRSQQVDTEFKLPIEIKIND